MTRVPMDPKPMGKKMMKAQAEAEKSVLEALVEYVDQLLSS